MNLETGRCIHPSIPGTRIAYTHLHGEVVRGASVGEPGEPADTQKAAESRQSSSMYPGAAAGLTVDRQPFLDSSTMIGALNPPRNQPGPSGLEKHLGRPEYPTMLTSPTWSIVGALPGTLFYLRFASILPMRIALHD